jgi:hypothetical protein
MCFVAESIFNVSLPDCEAGNQQRRGVLAHNAYGSLDAKRLTYVLFAASGKDYGIASPVFSPLGILRRHLSCTWTLCTKPFFSKDLMLR